MLNSPLPNQIPAPPLGMIMPPAYSHIVTTNAIVIALVMVWIFRDSYKTKSWIPLLIMAGSVIASLNECLWDTLGSVWYPQYGQVPLYRIFNVSVPVWMLVAYPCGVGAQAYWVYRRLNQGVSRASLWRTYAFFWFLNFLLEMPVLAQKVYVYYGPQPFKVLGFPLSQAMGNALAPIVTGLIVYVWKDYFVGLRRFLILLAVPVGQVIALAGVEWPMFLAMNSGRGFAATYPAAIVAMVISLTIVHMFSVKFCLPVAAARKQTNEQLGQTTTQLV